MKITISLLCLLLAACQTQLQTARPYTIKDTCIRWHESAVRGERIITGELIRIVCDSMRHDTVYLDHLLPARKPGNTTKPEWHNHFDH